MHYLNHVYLTVLGSRSHLHGSFSSRSLECGNVYGYIGVYMYIRNHWLSFVFTSICSFIHVDVLWCVWKVCIYVHCDFRITGKYCFFLYRICILNPVCCMQCASNSHRLGYYLRSRSLLPMRLLLRTLCRLLLLTQFALIDFRHIQERYWLRKLRHLVKVERVLRLEVYLGQRHLRTGAGRRCRHRRWAAAVDRR